MNAVGKCIDFR